jgi:hypothetical protein
MLTDVQGRAIGHQLLRDKATDIEGHELIAASAAPDNGEYS